jgi:hypothetical protein
MSSQEIDLYPDEGDDLVMAFLEQEAEIEGQCQGQDQAKRGSKVGVGLEVGLQSVSQLGTTMKRARTRSASPEPDMVNPHAMGLKVEGKVDMEATDSRSKRRRVERSPSIEVLEVRTTSTSTKKSKAQIKGEEKKSTIKREQLPPSSPFSSSPIVILEPPVAWPPGKMTSAEGIKQAHTAHRKYLAASSSSGPSPASVVSSPSCLAAVPTGMKKSMGDLNSISRTRTQIKQEQPHQSQRHEYQPTMVKIHPSMTGESSQTTLTPQLDEFDEDTKSNPITNLKVGPPKFKFKGKVKKEEEEENFVVTRDEKGNLTERARRALDKQLLESLGREENAITNSDLYSR